MEMEKERKFYMQIGKGKKLYMQVGNRIGLEYLEVHLWAMLVIAKES